MYNLFSYESNLEDYPILGTDAQAIINFVSCDGVMGYKLGNRLKHIYPDMYLSYKNSCLYEKNLTKGKILLWKKTTPWIINIPIKNTWKEPLDNEFLQQGIEKLAFICEHFNIKDLAFQKHYINQELLESLLETVKLPKIKFYEENP